MKLILTGKMLDNAQANFQYYVHNELPGAVVEAFGWVILFELMLVTRAQTTKISNFFSHRSGIVDGTHQGFIWRNVAILPENTMTLFDVIPASQYEIHEPFVHCLPPMVMQQDRMLSA